MLHGQKALVTGASSGIGRACALALGRAGADVLVNFVGDEASAKEVVREICLEGADAYYRRADVSRETEVEAMFADMKKRFGRIDILVANAGIQRDRDVLSMTIEEWRSVLDVNLTGQFLCVRAAARAFLEQERNESISRAAGKVICMSSVHQSIPWAGHVNYAASKGGVKLMMESLAQELAPRGVRVNAIAPGAIATDINRTAWETAAARHELLKLIPYGRVGTPDDVARTAVWLASDESDYLVGATLFVDGGMMLFPGFATGG